MNPELRTKGYLPCRALIEESVARILYKTLLLSRWRGEGMRDNHVPTAFSFTGLAPIDALLLEMQPRIETIAACRLVPTYGYARLYLHGDAFPRHRDRPSCEVSTSIHLGRDGGDGGLWVPPNTQIEMEAGDGVVYLGCETEHWRERFIGRTMGQVFLHYVDADGPYSDRGFDGQAHRFPPSLSDGTKS